MNNQAESGYTISETTFRGDEILERRQARLEARGNQPGAGAIIIGILLVLMGVIYLLENVIEIYIPIDNWEALLILIPVFYLFSRSIRLYQLAGNCLTSAVWNSGFFGIVLLVLMGVILFELDTEIWGPTVVILIGLGMLAGALIKRREA